LKNKKTYIFKFEISAILNAAKEKVFTALFVKDFHCQ